MVQSFLSLSYFTNRQKKGESLPGLWKIAVQFIESFLQTEGDPKKSNPSLDSIYPVDWKSIYLRQHFENKRKEYPLGSLSSSEFI